MKEQDIFNLMLRTFNLTKLQLENDYNQFEGFSALYFDQPDGKSKCYVIDPFTFSGTLTLGYLKYDAQYVSRL